MKKKATILNAMDRVIHYFEERDKITIVTWDLEPNGRVGKMTL